MKRHRPLPSVLVIFFLSIILLAGCKEEPDWNSLDLLEKLNSLKGVTATEITPAYNYAREFQIDVEQPVDHNNPNGPKFKQRVYLSHSEESMPMVFAPNGYGTTYTSNQEIARILQTNCLAVTHRFFYDARPDPLDWQYLTVEQAAADHHHIVQLFKKIYRGKWISSGASKGGLTVLFHKRYYPDDVDATIAYVAPFSFGPKDTRFSDYLNALGDGCISKLKAIQVYALSHRQETLGYINSLISSGSDTYSLNRELLMELEIMDYPFTFWQYYSINCSQIPDTSLNTSQEIFAHWSSIVPPSNFSDANQAYFEPYVYQSMTELGAPAYEYDYLRPYLKKVDPDASVNPNYMLLAPKDASYTFNYSTVPEIYHWLQDSGNNIIYIYGKNDPWSGGAIELTNQSTDAVFVMQEGKNHGVKITGLSDPDVVYTALEHWLGITITPPGKKEYLTPEVTRQFR
jgi:hypothetical protein